MVNTLNQYLNKTLRILHHSFLFFTFFTNSQFVPTERSIKKTQDKIIELFGEDVFFTTLDFNI